jgi:hypothetical protein
MRARLQRLLAPDGRNVIQHPDRTAMTRAFMAILQDGATPEQALSLLRE